MRAIVILPVHLGSTRLPRKFLQEINGVPLFWRAFKEAERVFPCPVMLAAPLSERDQWLAAARDCDLEPEQCFVFTSEGLRNGTERCADAATILEGPVPGNSWLGQPPYEVVVNCQADMPYLRPEFIRVFERLADPRIEMATLAGDWGDRRNDGPHVVKVIGEEEKDFTRRDVDEAAVHIGIYAYKRDALRRYAATQPADRELGEGLEQLRCPDAGIRIGVTYLTHAVKAIDVPGDLLHAGL